MVFEYMVNVSRAEKYPWDIFFFGVLYTFLAAFLSFKLFPESASSVSILLVVIASLPLVYDSIRHEEREDIKLHDESHILKQHEHFVWFVLFLFFGITIGFFSLYLFLPKSMLSTMFQLQINTIQNVNAPSGGVVSPATAFILIFFNNLKVLIFCLLFSFLYGSGAIFILTWNASVLGVAMGNFFRETISKLVPSASSYFAVGTLSLLRYSIHGIPEILAYLVAGLAGSLISMAVVNNDFRTKRFYKVLDDSTDLLVISVLLLFLAALLEVFVTPLFFSA